MTYTTDELENQTLGPAEAGRMLRVTAKRVIQLSDEGSLPAIRTPIGRLFLVDDVERLAMRRAAAA